MISVVHRMPWALVDPASRAFDAAAAREIAVRIVRPLTRDGPLETQRAVEDPRQTACARELDLALIAHYGAWVAGWNWSTSEPGGGGPVGGWCCARDSVLAGGEPADATIDRVVAAVCEWRAFLEELSRMQSELRAEAGALSREDAIERAAGRYVRFVVARTGVSDAWYSTFVKVLAWHLEAQGDKDDRIEDRVCGRVGTVRELERAVGVGRRGRLRRSRPARGGDLARAPRARRARRLGRRPWRRALGARAPPPARRRHPRRPPRFHRTARPPPLRRARAADGRCADLHSWRGRRPAHVGAATPGGPSGLTYLLDQLAGPATSG